MSILGRIALGLVSSAVATAAMPASELLEMSASGHKGSTVPGQVGAHLLPGRDPDSTADAEALNTAVHWTHGITVGALRGVLDAAGLRGPTASAVQVALLWGGDATLYRTPGIADAPWRWTGAELGADRGHKAVYATVTGPTYDALTARADEAREVVRA